MSEVGTAYNAAILDHFLNPRNAGGLPDADGVGEVGATAFGDVVRISLKIKNGKIVEAGFKTFGCGTAIASSSVTTELLKGRTLAEAMNFSGQEVSQALGGLPPAKSHCGVMAEEAVRAALNDYFQRHPDAFANLKAAPDLPP